MHRPIALAVVCVLALAPAGVAVQQATFRRGVDIVRVSASVQDRDGRLLTSLARDDFELLDNGRPVEIVAFSNDPQPLTLTLMLQMSYSMAPQYVRLTAAARHLINALQPPDRIRVGTFTNEVAVSPLLTSNRTVLDRVLREEMWPYGLGLRPWAAIDAATMSLDAESGRRAVVMLTAMSGPWGEDRNFMPTGRMPTEKERARFSSTSTSEFVRRRMVERDVALYIVGVAGSDQDLPSNFLRLTEDSGGGHFVLPHNADLAAAFADVAEELRHQYVLGFVPTTLDGREHRLQVRVRRAGATARARQSYFAEASGPDTGPASPAIMETATTETAVVSMPRARAPISAYVTTKGGRPLPSLTAGDFDVRIDGERQPVVQVATGRDAPLTIAVVVDESDSLHSGVDTAFPNGQIRPLHNPSTSGGFIQHGRSVVVSELIDFFEEVVLRMKPGDRMQLGTIGRAPELTEAFSVERRRELLDAGRRALMRVPGLQEYPSPIWDIVDRAVAALASDRGPGVVLLLTDGAASANRLGFAEMEARAVKAGVPIHVVGARDGPLSIQQIGAESGRAIRISPQLMLQRLATATGGSYASMASQVDPRGQARRIMQELASTYFLEIGTPARGEIPGAIASLDVRVARSDAQVRARRGY